MNFSKVVIAIAVFIASNLFATGVEIGNALTGVEIGNASTKENGGVEIGNGWVTNDIYKLKKVVGAWRIEALSSYVALTMNTGAKIETRGVLDMSQSDDILNLDELLAWGADNKWVPVKIGKVEGIMRDTASKSGVRTLEYKLYFAPTELLKAHVEGPVGDLGFDAFAKFEKTLESLEVLPRV